MTKLFRSVFVATIVVTTLFSSFNSQLCLGQDPALDPFGPSADSAPALPTPVAPALTVPAPYVAPPVTAQTAPQTAAVPPADAADTAGASTCYGTYSGPALANGGKMTSLIRLDGSSVRAEDENIVVWSVKDPAEVETVVFAGFGAAPVNPINPDEKSFKVYFSVQGKVVTFRVVALNEGLVYKVAHGKVTGKGPVAKVEIISASPDKTQAQAQVTAFIGLVQRLWYDINQVEGDESVGYGIDDVKLAGATVLSFEEKDAVKDLMARRQQIRKAFGISGQAAVAQVRVTVQVP